MLHFRTCILLALSTMPWQSVLAADVTSPPADPATSGQSTLDQQRGANTWGHPDQFHEFAGMHAYAAGRYGEALDEFKQAARYADKPSQLSIGLMYLQGQGVAKDIVTAYAWISLAAERGYPQFVATRDSLGSKLVTEQRDKAQALLQQLIPEYGDLVAKPRMALELRRAMMSIAPDGRVQQGTYTSTGGTANVGLCGPANQHAAGDCDFYASWRWDPNQYFAARDAQWQPAHGAKPTVTVLPSQPVQPPAAADKPSG